MSQKGRLRRLESGVCWLETEGRYRRIVNLMKINEMAEKFADRVAADPAHAAKVKKEMPFFYAYMSRVSAGLRPPAPSSPPSPEPEAAPRVVPILLGNSSLRSNCLDAAVPGAPQDEGGTDRSINTDLRSERSECPGAFERSRSKRPEGSEPAPPPAPAPTPAPRPVMPGQPAELPSPDMQIRPVHWRPRGVRDYYDEPDVPGTNGRCITEYDPLRDEYDDDES